MTTNNTDSSSDHDSSSAGSGVPELDEARARLGALDYNDYSWNIPAPMRADMLIVLRALDQQAGSTPSAAAAPQPIAGQSQQEAQLARVLAEHAAYLGACRCGWTPARGMTATPETWAEHVAAAVLRALDLP